MFKKDSRVRLKKDFDYIFKVGKSNFDKTLGVKFIYNNLSISKFSVVVGKKVNKSAVARNKIKRKIREVLKSQQQKGLKNIDCIIIALPSVRDKGYNDIKESIERSFQKLRLYK